MHRMILALALIACDEGGGGAEFRSPPRAAPPPPDEGRTDPPVATPDAEPPTDASLDAHADAMAAEETWPLRSCDTTVRYEGDASEVLLAGDFTSWLEGALPLRREGDAWSITLGPEQGLVPGRRHAYKLVVDGAWRVDGRATHHQYDGECANSALLAPACTLRPEIRAEPVEVEGTTAHIVVTFYATTDAAPVRGAALSLDGVPADFEIHDGRVEVVLEDLAPGRHVVSARAEDALPVDLVFWIEDAPFDHRDGALYMLLVDRFANGDRGIDDPVGPPVDHPADWHGGDLWGATAVLEAGYFEALGVNSIWLSPLNEQVDGHFGERDGGERQIAAYHGYWPISGRAVEPRFGGDEALRTFVEAAHARGIRVLLDLINNQVHEEHEYFREHPEWFRTSCVCGVDPGCGWSERPLDCLFAPYLPDIDWRHPEAEARFIADAVWWVETFGVDGFRVDAVKHVETSAVFNLRAELHRRFEQGGTRVVMLGETAVGEGDVYDDGCGERYESGYAWIEAYTGQNALDGQFDFPTHHRIQWGVLTGTMGYDQVEEALAQMEARYAPDALHVRFLGSHDSSRMASIAAQDPARGCRFQGAAPCESLPGTVDDPAVFQRLRRAWALLLTMPGVPLLYYGDELAMAGAGDPDSRRDMLWDGAEAELAMSLRLPTPAQAGLRDWIAEIGRARAAHPALRRGRRRVLTAEPDLYIYERSLDDDAALVILNRGPERTVELTGGWTLLTGAGQLVEGGVGVSAGEALILGRSP